MARKKRCATYVSENMGRSTDRPELEKLIQEAGKKPKPFDMVITYSMDVFGTPEEAQNTVARFRELGVEVSTVAGGIGPYGWEGSPGRIVQWLSKNQPPGMTEQERDDRQEVLELVQDTGTTRMIIDRMAVIGMMEKRTPTPWETRRRLRWPSEDNLYIEYARAMIMDREREDDPEELTHGITVAQGENPREVTTIITREGHLILERCRVNLIQGTSKGGDHLPEEFREEYGKEAGIALTGLAALIANLDTKRTKMPTTGEEDQENAWHLIEPR